MIPVKGDKGLALLPVLLVITVLLVSTTFLAVLAGHKLQNVAREQKLIQSFYAAEAGLELIKINFWQQPAWYYDLPMRLTDNDGNFATLIPSTNMGENTYFQVDGYKRKQEVGATLLLRSVGTCETTDNEIVARQTLLTYLGVFTTGDYFKGVVLLPLDPGTAAMLGPIQINAPLVVDGKVSLTTDRVVNGNICASGKIIGYFSGQPRPDYLYIPPRPTLNDNYYLDLAAMDNQVWDTDATLGGPIQPLEDDAEAQVYVYHGFYYVHGDISISGYYQGQGVLFCTGDIIVTDDLIPGHGGGVEIGGNSLTLVAAGDVDIAHHLVYANVLANGQCWAQTGARLHGAVCAAGITVTNQGQGGRFIVQHEDNLLVPENALEGLNVKTVEWRENFNVF